MEHTLDYFLYPLEVLSEIMGVINGDTTILVDYGFGRGRDVLRD